MESDQGAPMNHPFRAAIWNAAVCSTCAHPTQQHADVSGDIWAECRYRGLPLDEVAVERAGLVLDRDEARQLHLAELVVFFDRRISILGRVVAARHHEEAEESPS